VYLVDTNVVSEARNGKKANPGVLKFFQATDSSDLYLSVQTIGEIRRGLESVRHRGDLPQASKLEKWLDLLTTEYADRILDFDEECAQIWGRLMSPHHDHPIDKQIAAIALIHDLTVATRNLDDFRATGVRVLNPFEYARNVRQGIDLLAQKYSSSLSPPMRCWPPYGRIRMERRRRKSAVSSMIPIVSCRWRQHLAGGAWWIG
jgi:predicted nucleic acid-binding protein